MWVKERPGVPGNGGFAKRAARAQWRMKDSLHALQVLKTRLPQIFARWRGAAWRFPAGPSCSIARKSEQDAATRDWEDEGGSLRPDAAQRKLPF